MRLFDVEEARRLVPALGAAFGEIRGRLKRIQENSDLLKSLAEPAGETVDADFITKSERLPAEREQIIAQVPDRRFVPLCALVPKLESEGKELAAGVRFFEHYPARLQLAIGPLDWPAIRTYKPVNRRLDDYRRVPESV